MGKSQALMVVTAAKDADEARELCRKTKAYEQILIEFPASRWHREWIATYEHSQEYWTNEFRVTRRDL